MPFNQVFATNIWSNHDCDINKIGYRRDSARRQLLHRSRLLKVIDFGTNRKPVYHFLLVITLNPILHRYLVIAQDWSSFRFGQMVGLPLC